MNISGVNKNIYSASYTSTKTKVPKEVIKRLGLNMQTRVGYTGEKDFMLAPDSVPVGLKEWFRRSMINWNTHVEKNKNNHL